MKLCAATTTTATTVIRVSKAPSHTDSNSMYSYDVKREDSGASLTRARARKSGLRRRTG